MKMRHLVYFTFALCCCLFTYAARIRKAAKPEDTKYVASMLNDYINNLTEHIQYQPEFLESLQQMNATHGEPNISLISNDIIQKLNQLKMDFKQKILAISKMDTDKSYPIPLDLLKVLDAGHPEQFTGADIRAIYDRFFSQQTALLNEQDKILKELEISEILERWEKHASDTESQRQAYVKEFQAAEKKRHAEKQFQPGSQAQEKETWREADEFDEESYSPDLFFLRHDVNSDGYLDIDEIEGLFSKNFKAERSDPSQYKHIVDSMRRTLELIDTDGDNRISRAEHLEYERSVAALDTSKWDHEDNLEDLGAVVNEHDMEILENELEALGKDDTTNQSDMLKNLRRRAEKLRMRMKGQLQSG